MEAYRVVLILLIIVLSSSCGEHPGEKVVSSVKNESESVVSSDTSNVSSYPVSIDINESVQLVFTRVDNDSLGYNPLIVKKGVRHAISGMEEITTGFDGSFAISPNKRFVELGMLDKGEIQLDEQNSSHERWFCVVIDTKSDSIVHYMQSDCDGNWNEDNDWINSVGQLVFISPE